jgi:plastocyanin
VGEGASRRPWAIAGCLFVLSQIGVLAWGAEIHTIVQKGRHFSAKEIDVARADTVAFDNEDEFIHQIYVKSPNFNFESAEQPPGQFVDVKFTKAGTFTVLCEIHPKMHLTVNVQ